MGAKNWHSDALSTSAMDEFMAAVVELLDLDPQQLPAEGVGDLVTAQGVQASYAISRSSECASVRVLEAPGTRDLSHLRVGPGHYRITLSLYGCTTEEPVVPPAFSAGYPLSPRLTPLPSFMEVASVLLSSNSFDLQAGQFQDVLAGLQSERDYYAGLANELADELRRERVKQKHFHPSYLAQAEDTVQPSDEPPEFSRWQQLPEWCVANADRIVVLPRALSGAKKALYESPEMAFSALEFLAGPYRESRSGKLSAADMQAELERRGLRLAGAVGQSVAGENKDDYFLNYQGRRRFLEFHIGRGGGRDERYCLRIYFFWDASANKAVVGWLPSHLDNSLT